MTPTHRSFRSRTALKYGLLGLPIAAIAIAIFLLSGKPPSTTEAGGGHATTTPEKHDAAMAQKDPTKLGLEAQLQEAKAQAAENAAKAQELHQKLMTAEAEGTVRPKGAAWLRDPEMSKVIENEAKEAAIRSANALLQAGLAQQLGLNDEQSEKLKQLLIDRTSILWNKMLLPMSTGELDGPGKAAAGKIAKQEFERNTTELHALLGNGGFETYQRFEKTQPDRDLVKQFGPQCTKAGQDLSAQQQSQLLTIMADERVNFHFQHELGDPMQMDFEHWDDNFTEDKVNTYFRQAGELNDRIAQRAQTVLTPEQTALLRDFHAEHLRRAKFTVRSTMAMMGQKR
jgi:hypothetical protein